MTLYLCLILVVIFLFKVSKQCDHGEVRLVGGSGPHEGRVEICNYSQWGRVCSAKWDDNDAIVVCRQLGFSPHGASTSTGTEFGQGDGTRWLDNVQCNPKMNRALLECDATGANITSCIDHDAGVKCSHEQRVRDVTAHIVNTPCTSTGHTVSVTWEQNLTATVPISYKVECHSERHGMKITVSNGNSNTQLRELSSSYNCCVSAVYPLYEAKAVCTVINATSKCEQPKGSNLAEQPKDSNLAMIVGGILGIIIVMLLCLLSLSMVCLVRQHVRKRVIPESIPTEPNVSYSSIAARRSQSTIPGTSTKVTKSTSEDEPATNHTYDVIPCSSFHSLHAQ